MVGFHFSFMWLVNVRPTVQPEILILGQHFKDICLPKFGYFNDFFASDWLLECDINLFHRFFPLEFDRNISALVCLLEFA